MAYTFTRFYVDAADTIDRAEFIERLRALAFKPIDPASEDGSSSGWCAFGGTYEPGVGDPNYGDLVAFGLRTDTLRIPAARLKHEVEIERRRVMDERKLDSLNHYQVAEIKADVIARLRQTTPPSISHVPVVLDLEAGVLWAFTASEAALETIDEMFCRTAERALTRETVYTRLRRLGVSAGVDGLGTFSAIACDPDGDGGDDGDASQGFDLLDRVLRCTHLAPEFMLWLWWRSERDDGMFALGGELGDVEVWQDDRMVLASSAVNAQTDTFRGGHPATSAEAREALRLGKLPIQAKVGVVRGAQRWDATIKAHDLGLSGVKIPAVLSREDDELLAERMLLLGQLCAVLDALMVAFVRERKAADWPATHEAIRAWAASDYEAPVAEDVRELLKGVPVTTETQGPRRLETAARCDGECSVRTGRFCADCVRQGPRVVPVGRSA